jgi:hypothetical protein
MSRIADPIADGCRALEAVLVQQEELYARLRILVAERREAVRTADLDRLRTSLEEERRVVARLADLDKQRTDIAAALGRRLGLVQPGRPVQVDIAQLAARAPQGIRERLVATSERLKHEILLVRRESGVVRQAAEALAGHLAGILQSVSGAFAGARCYGPAGRVATATPIRSLDLKT